MNLKDLNLIIKNKKILDKKLQFFAKKQAIKKFSADKAEVLGHIEKAEHNLNFIRDNINLGYSDWCITGCYYAVYHAALALIISRGYHSKSHDATLCLLIREYFNNGINQEDIFLINKFFLDYLDLVVYVQAKDKREEASYSTKYVFDKKMVQELRIKAISFINKCKLILNNLD